MKSLINHRDINFISFLTKKQVVLFLFSALLFTCSERNNEDPELNNEDPELLSLNCDAGTTGALSFNAFIHHDVRLTNGDSEGPIAMGGNLTINGIFTAAAHTSGTFFHENDEEASSLIVNGKINYMANEGIHLNNGYVKIGDLSGSIVHDLDNNNAVSNTRITQGSYNDQPRIHVQRQQEALSVSAINILDFDNAFEALNIESINYSELPNTTILENGNKITLFENTLNILHLTGEELNNIIDFTFNNQPTKTSPLIINIDNEDDFVWNVKNQAGIGDQHGAHIIFNFYNNSSIITLDSGGGTVTGSILAPNSHVIKKTSGNINGQVIAASYDHLEGELHQHVIDICIVVAEKDK